MSELGNTLKEARERNGLSLDDLQNITKIQKRYLVGIETGNYDMMPGKFYVRAFIKQYAEAVGLEPEEVFEQFKNEIPSVHDEEAPEQLSRVQSKKTMSPTQSKLLDALPKALVAVFIIGVLVLVWVLVSKYVSPNETNSNESGSEIITIEENEDSPLNKENTEEEDKDKTSNEAEDTNKAEDESTTEQEVNQELKVLESTGKRTTYELTNADEFKVKFVSTGNPWVGIEGSNGSYLFQQTLTDGQETEEQDLSDQEEVLLNTGRAHETQIYINGELLEYATSPSEQMSQKITILYKKEAE